MSAQRAVASKVRAQAEARRLNPMIEFVWQGRDKRGVVMKGEQLAKNANLLRAELRKQGITPTVVKPKPKPLFGGGATRIKPRDIAIFSRQLATMMKSGVPIVMALEIIAGGQKNPAMKKMVNGLKAEIESGASIYEALSLYPVQFDELYRNLVRAGESSGVLETVLETIASYKENIETIKGKIKKALLPRRHHCRGYTHLRRSTGVRGSRFQGNIPELWCRPPRLHQFSLWHFRHCGQVVVAIRNRHRSCLWRLYLFLQTIRPAEALG